MSSPTPHTAPVGVAPAPPPALVLPLPAAAAPARSGPPWRLLGIGAVVLLAAGGFGGRLWWHSVTFADTDNATVSGHVHPVAARIAGVVVEMNMQDNQRVAAGAPLLRLDTGDAQVQIERIRAQLLQADATIAGSVAQIAQARAQAAAAGAQIVQSQAALSRAELDAARSQRLFSAELRAVSKQELDAATAAREGASADLNAKRAFAAAAQQTIAGAQAAREAALAQKAALQAQLKDAQLAAGLHRRAGAQRRPHRRAQWGEDRHRAHPDCLRARQDPGPEHPGPGAAGGPAAAAGGRAAQRVQPAGRSRPLGPSGLRPQALKQGGDRLVPAFGTGATPGVTALYLAVTARGVTATMAHAQPPLASTTRRRPPAEPARLTASPGAAW